MILAVHSDASYLSEKKSRSQAGRNFYLTNHTDKTFNNGSVLTISSIIKHILASASEAELAAIFYRSCKAIYLRITLEEMSHLQPPTNVTIDNSEVHRLTQGIMVPKQYKAMGMRFRWLKCQEAQGHPRYL